MMGKNYSTIVTETRMDNVPSCRQVISQRGQASASGLVLQYQVLVSEQKTV